MTFDAPATQDQPILKRPSTAQIEEGKARFRARYLAWKQQRAVVNDESAKSVELPHGG